MESPKEAKDRIMHASLKIGRLNLMGADHWPGTPHQSGNNFAIGITPESLEETERLFAALGQNGNTAMALQDTFWGARFGTLLDPFGIRWMFNFEKPKMA